MEAPIPASALIHSATLVSVGVYLLLRKINTINQFYYLQMFVLFSGLLTIVVFTIIAFLQTDIKKILAYSTIANCGFLYILLITTN